MSLPGHMRYALDRHLDRPLSMPARTRARLLRRALYASWTVPALRAEFVLVMAAKRAARTDAQRSFLVDLEADLRNKLEDHD